MSTTPPNFDRADYIEPTETMQGINAPALPDSALFWRAILFGIGGAILGAAIYGLFMGLTHINIGYLAILVAWLIAKGMTMGSQGQGGRAYQIIAVVMTYFAVAAANAGLFMWEVLRVPGGHASVFYAAFIGVFYPILHLQTSVFGGAIGLFILFIGMRAAWRMTSGIPGAVRHPFAR
jgi:hypothetical protein